MGATIRRSDRWEGVNVLLPDHKGACCITNGITSFGDVLVNAVQSKEIGGGHPHFSEDVGADVIAVGHPTHRLDHETQEDIAAIAVAASFSRREVGRLVHAL